VYFVYNNKRNAQTNVTFLIDGQPRGSLLRIGTGIADEEGWIYNMSAFSLSGLNGTQHTLIINQGVQSMIVLDYLKYTPSAPTSYTSTTSVTKSSTISSTRTSASVPSSHTPVNDTPRLDVGTIIGATIGGTVVIICMAIAAFLARRRRAFKRRSVDLGT